MQDERDELEDRPVEEVCEHVPGLFNDAGSEARVQVGQKVWLQAPLEYAARVLAGIAVRLCVIVGAQCVLACRARAWRLGSLLEYGAARARSKLQVIPQSSS